MTHISNENIYYVYGYYVQNVPIYIGCGKNKRSHTHLKDCNKLSTRNKIIYFYNKLRNLLNENIEIEIKILKSNLSFTDSRLFEEILIELCGRRIYNTGTLYNITTGGEGATGYKMTDTQKNKLRKINLIRCNTPEYKEWFMKNIYKDNRISIAQYSVEGNFIKTWNSITEACNFYNTEISNLHTALSDINKTAKGYRWVKYKKDCPQVILPIKKTKINRTYKINKVKALFSDGSEQIYTSANIAAKELNLNHNCIRAVCIKNKGRTQYKGIKFNYI